MGLILISPRNQRGLAYLFEIKEDQTNPEYIDMGAIAPVIDMNFGGYAKMHDYTNLLYCAEAGSTIGGLQTKTWNILSYGNATGADQQIVVPVGYNTIIWGIKCYLQTDAAGAGALSAKYFNCNIKMVCPIGGGTDVTKWRATFIGHTGVQLYQPGGADNVPPLNRNDLYIVPDACKLTMVWWMQDGSTFPANTNIIYHIVAQSFPIGAPLPQGI